MRALPVLPGPPGAGTGSLPGLRGRRGAGMRAPPALRGRQRGVALITAILLVALATMLAAAIGYRNAMTARRGAATFAFDQSLQISEAAEAIAAYALRATRQSDRTYTYAAQPWGQPYGPVDIVPGVQLEAWLTDEQGRFNLNSLVQANGSTDPNAVAVFQRLLTILGLEPTWAPLFADWIDSDSIPNSPDGAEDSVYLSQTPPYRPPNMLVTSASELLALPGFGRDRYLKLAPYVTALPYATPINLCTAPAALLNALGPPDSSNFSDEELMHNRQSACFPTQSDFDAIFGNDPTDRHTADNMVGVRSDFFRLTSIVTIGSTQFALYSLLYQDDATLRVRSIQRSFTAD